MNIREQLEYPRKLGVSIYRFFEAWRATARVLEQAAQRYLNEPRVKPAPVPKAWARLSVRMPGQTEQSQVQWNGGSVAGCSYVVNLEPGDSEVVRLRVHRETELHVNMTSSDGSYYMKDVRVGTLCVGAEEHPADGFMSGYFSAGIIGPDTLVEVTVGRCP